MLIKIILIALIAVSAPRSGATSELKNIGNGLIYDSVLNVTWLSDMNFAKTSGIDLDGAMTWEAAVAFADNLEYAGYSDWRLPTLLENDPTCDGAFDSDVNRTTPGASMRGGCTGGELSHLFVVSLGNKSGESVLYNGGDTTIQISNQALFSNVGESIYWSRTRRVDLQSSAWAFSTNNGLQLNNRNILSSHRTLLLRTGDVSPVPEPSVIALLVLGLLFMHTPVVIRRSKNQQIAFRWCTHKKHPAKSLVKFG